MKLLIQSAMIFFGTLMAAGVVALGEPAQAVLAFAGSGAPQSAPSAAAKDLGSHRGWSVELALRKGAAGPLR